MSKSYNVFKRRFYIYENIIEFLSFSISQIFSNCHFWFAELMLMGFISFLLTVGQKPISKICIPKGIAYSMLPCEKEMALGRDHCSKC